MCNVQVDVKSEFGNNVDISVSEKFVRPFDTEL